MKTDSLEDISFGMYIAELRHRTQEAREYISDLTDNLNKCEKILSHIENMMMLKINQERNND